MKLEKIISGYPCEVTGDISREIDELEYSSSECTANTLFFCLRGANADGHNYAADAYRRGCRAFVCDRALELGDGTVQIICEDTRAALASMSARFYGNCAEKLKIIGITGTKGKTTTSLLISAILNEAGHPCAYIGSNGIVIKDLHIDTVNTTPESRDLHHYFKLMADVGIEYVAMEVSSQALAHHRVDGISFAAGVFLNLSEDHIGGSEHPDFEDYRRSKARLFSEHDPRLAVYNADDCYSEGIVSGADCPKVTFSAAGKAADYSADEIAPFRDDYYLGVSFRMNALGKSVPVRLCSPGAFSVSNALAAVAVCESMGVPAQLCANVLSHTSVLGRCEIVEGLPGRTFVIDYAHNGLSLTNTLKVLREYNPTRLICVFGSVGGRTRGRRAELAHASSNLADMSIISSDNPDFEEPESIISDIVENYDGPAPYKIIPDRELAVREAVRISEPGDIVLFAGKGHENYQLIKGEHVPFSEREIIQDECSAVMMENR